MEKIEEIIEKKMRLVLNDFTNDIKKIINEEINKKTTSIEKKLQELEDKIKNLEKENSELKESVEFVGDVMDNKCNEDRDKIEKQEKNIQENAKKIEKHEEILKQQQTQMDKQESEDKNRMRIQEDRSRRNNLRIDGIFEHQNESWSSTKRKTANFFKDDLGLSDIVIERAHRVGKKENGKKRTIVLKLLNWHDKIRIYKSFNEQRINGIYINDDYSKETVQIRKSLKAELTRRREQGENVTIRYDKIVNKNNSRNRHDSD